VIATGVAATGRREVLGLAVGDSEAGAFWTAFLRSLKARGLAGVQLVIADAHTGLRGAAQAVFTRGRDPALPGPLRAQRPGPGPKGSAEMVAAAIRTVFAQPKADMIRDQLEVIATMLGRQFPTVEQMLRDAAEDSLAFADFPAGYWKKISSTHTLGRLDRGVKRRTDVVAVFPNPAALLRLAGAVLVEAHDQWQVSDRRYLSEGSTALLTAPATETGKEVATRDLIPA
jgi:putative transposase